MSTAVLNLERRQQYELWDDAVAPSPRSAPPPPPRRSRFSISAVVRSLREMHPSAAFDAVVALCLLAGVLVVGWGYRQSRRFNQEIESLKETVRLGQEEHLRFVASIERERRAGDAERRRLEAQIEEFRHREELLTGRLADATAGEVQTLRNDLRVTHERLQTIETERVSAERIISRYGAGVCLIQGSYALYDAGSRPLRHRVDERGKMVRREDGSPILDVEGTGAVYTTEFFGTGFLVDRDGLIMTNRHLAEPWTTDEMAQEMENAGFAPRFTSFRAFFPRVNTPFEVRVAKHSSDADLALLRTNLRGRVIPVLPLDRSGRGAIPGQPVVLVGYPRGLDAIMAKADSAVVDEILAIHRNNSQLLTEVLSRRGLIRPSTTQGHIGDVTKTDIVFDALTTQGSSGGPLFNRSGEVIAVEYAVLEKFGGSSFGIPIRYALELLLAKPPRKAVGPA